MLIDFPIGATIKVTEDLEGNCKKCIFSGEKSNCAFSICKVACEDKQRKDGKNIMFTTDVKEVITDKKKRDRKWHKKFYCLLEFRGENCAKNFDCADCKFKLHRHPTPQEYRKDFGFDYPDDGAVYCFTFDGAGWSWIVCEYKWAKEHKEDTEPVVCASSPFGKPNQ